MVYIGADFADYHDLPRFGGMSLEVMTAYRDFEEVDLICYEVKMRGIPPLDYMWIISSMQCLIIIVRSLMTRLHRWRIEFTRIRLVKLSTAGYF